MKYIISLIKTENILTLPFYTVNDILLFSIFKPYTRFEVSRDGEVGLLNINDGQVISDFNPWSNYIQEILIFFHLMLVRFFDEVRL